MYLFYQFLRIRMITPMKLPQILITIKLFSNEVEYKTNYALEWPHMGSIKDNYKKSF